MPQPSVPVRWVGVEACIGSRPLCNYHSQRAAVDGHLAAELGDHALGFGQLGFGKLELSQLELGQLELG